MLRRGKKTGRLGGHTMAGDAAKLPFADNAFHAATIAFGIRNIPDIDNFIREVCRVLQLGGRFVVLELVRPTNPLINLVYDNVKYFSHILE